MIDILTTFSNWIAPIFYKIVYMSIVGSVLGIFIFCLVKGFDSKLSAKWKCVLWLIPLCFFALPFNRIQIQTKSDFVVPSLMNEVETSLNNIHKEQRTNLKTNEEVPKTVTTSNTKVVAKESRVTTLTLDTILPILWLLGASVSIGIVVMGSINLKHKTKHMQKLEDSRIRLILKRSQRRLQVTKKIEIKLHNENRSPCIYGITQPKILLSKEFAKNDNEVIENVFMHELSHYKRKDMISNGLLLILMAVHWFNPLIYVFFKKIRQEMELATDEIALSRMNKEEKKQYGLTLINLLQTYQTEKIATKMLCITDDNKNMERRIKKIKLSTTLKKYKMSIVVLASLLVLCIASLFILKPTNAIMISQKEEALYEKVTQCLIDIEKKNHEAQERKNEEGTDDFKTFVDLQPLGIEQNADETYVYAWALVQSYYVQEQLVKNESSMPYKFTVKEDEIIRYEIPKDGSLYEESIEAIFPKEIIAKMKESEVLVDGKKLEIQAKEHYQYLEQDTQPSQNSEINAQMATGNEVDYLVGSWKPYRAEDENGEEINLRNVYGSGVAMYGGSLVFNEDGTYTEFIGVYAEAESDNFQGTYEFYEEEQEKAILRSNGGETKIVEMLDKTYNTIRVIFENGTVVYFSR